MCVGSSSGHVYVGKYDSNVNFWITPSLTGDKPMHRGSVNCVRFDPGSGHVVASASVDGKVIITSSFEQDIDNVSEASGPFAAVNTDADELFEFRNNAWVNTVQFSPSS